MKKKIAALAAVLICLATATGGTLAYFASGDTAHNVITSGSIGIEIIEKTRKDGVELDFPADGLKNIMPGSRVSKIVSVANSGSGAAWVRVKVETAIKGADESALPLSLALPGGAVPVMSFAVESGWIDGGDGYYYFSSPLPAGEKTGALFSEVAFDARMGNEYQNCTAQLTVSAQAVQAANNPIPAGGSAADVPGWPE